MSPEMRARLEEAREMEALGLEEDEEETFELEAVGDGDEDLDHVITDALDTDSDSFDDADVYVEDDAIEEFVIPGDFDDADFFDEGWLDDLDITVSEGDEYVEAGDGGAFLGKSNGMKKTPSGPPNGVDDDFVEPGSEAEYALAALDALFGGDDDELDGHLVTAEEASDARRRDRNARRRQNGGEDAVTCARCFSLRHYGVVKNEAAEILMPSFDFKARHRRPFKSSRSQRRRGVAGDRRDGFRRFVPRRTRWTSYTRTCSTRPWTCCWSRTRWTCCRRSARARA
jgi:hypothetical protein